RGGTLVITRQGGTGDKGFAGVRKRGSTGTRENRRNALPAGAAVHRSGPFRGGLRGYIPCVPCKEHRDEAQTCGKVKCRLEPGSYLRHRDRERIAVPRRSH